MRKNLTILSEIMPKSIIKWSERRLLKSMTAGWSLAVIKSSVPGSAEKVSVKKCERIKF